MSACRISWSCFSFIIQYRIQSSAKSHIFEEISPLCRLCGHLNETIDHLTTSCSYIAQTAYKHRHDKVAKFLHWKLLARYGVEVNSCWWKHSPSSVVENSACKILWDFYLTADRPICHDRLDNVVLSKQTI